MSKCEVKIPGRGEERAGRLGFNALCSHLSGGSHNPFMSTDFFPGNMPFKRNLCIQHPCLSLHRLFINKVKLHLKVYF